MYILIAVVGIAGHSICMTLIMKKRLIKTPRFLILFCLSISDCTFSCNGIIGYMIAANIEKGEKCILLTKAGLFLGTIIFQMSCLLSVMLTINQFIAVSYGIMYRAFVTCKKIRRTVAIVSVGLVIINSMTFIDKSTISLNSNTKVTMSRYGINTTIMWMAIVGMTVNIINGNRISAKQIGRLPSHQRQMPYWRRRQQIRKEITIVTIITIIAQLPLGVMYPKHMIKLDPETDEKAMFFSRGLLFAFCAWNPWLYMLTLHELRNSIGNTLRKFNASNLFPKMPRKENCTHEKRQIKLISFQSIAEHADSRDVVSSMSSPQEVITSTERRDLSKTDDTRPLSKCIHRLLRRLWSFMSRKTMDYSLEHSSGRSQTIYTIQDVKLTAYRQLREYSRENYLKF